MDQQISLLLAAASAASSAATDLIEAARDGSISAMGNAGSGETLLTLADAMNLFLSAAPAETEEEVQLHGAISRFIKDQST